MMRTMLRRGMAGMLAMALLIACCLSGVVLPVLAGTDPDNLLAGKVNALYTLNGGDAAQEITPAVSLKAGTRYALRVTAKADAAATVVSQTKTINVAVTTEWRVYQLMFTTTAAATTLPITMTFGSTDASQTVQLKNFELLEAPTDGTFNLIPGGDFVAQSSFLSKAHNAGLAVENDTEISGNTAVHFRSTNNTCQYWDASGINFTTGKILKLTFKLRGSGVLRIDCGDGSPVYMDNPDAFSVTGGGKYAYYKADDWTEFNYYIKVSGSNKLQWFMFSHRNTVAQLTDLWMDDLQMYEITPATGIALDKDTVTMAPDSVEQLFAQATPTGSMLLDSSLVWDTSDESVVKVDQSGMLIAQGQDGETAVVTVTSGSGYTDTCVVTIDADAQGNLPPSGNLIEGKVDASYAMQGGDSAITITAAATAVKQNTRYAVRVTAKADAAATVTFPGIANSAKIDIAQTSEWRTYQAIFTPTAFHTAFTMQVAFSGSVPTELLHIKNIELLEAPTDGTFNLMPGGDFTNQSSFLSKAHDMGLAIENDMDIAGNTAVHFKSTLNTCNYWNTAGLGFTTGKIFKLTFKLKGSGLLRIDCGDGSPVYLPNPDAVNVTSNGRYTFYKADEWTEFTYYIKPSNANQLQWFMFSHRDTSAVLTDLWMDDLRLYEISESEGLILNKAAVSLAPWGETQLKVSGTPANTIPLDQAYVWTSSDESVAVVDQNGKVSVVGVHGQTATITATSTLGSANCVVTVDREAGGVQAVDSIAISPSAVNMMAGATQQLAIVGTPAGYVVGRVTWSSDNPSVVSVNESGLLTAQDVEGTAVITATTEFGKTAVCAVSVTKPIPPVESQPNVNLLKEQVETAYAVNNTAPAVTIPVNVALKGGTQYVLRVNGKSTAGATLAIPQATGNVVLIAANDAWRASQAMFTVANDVIVNSLVLQMTGTDAADAAEIQNIELWEVPQDGSFNLLPGSSFDVQSSFLSKAHALGLAVEQDPDDPTNTALHFKSDKSYADYWNMAGIAFPEGKILKLTFRIKGGGVMRIDCGDGHPTYLPNPDAFSVSSNGAYCYYLADEWTEYTYYIKPSTANQLPWFMISNRSGSASLTDFWLDDLCMYALSPATDMKLNINAIALAPANYTQLTVHGVPDNALIVNSAITWTTSDATAVTVDEKGNVTAVGEHGQSAVITATNADGFTDSCVVTIDNTAPSMPQADSIVITPNGGELDPGESLQLNVNCVPSNTIVGRVTYTSDNEELATVDENGLVTAKAANGTVIITATSQFGKTASVAIKVHAQPNLLVNGDFEQDSSISWRNITDLKDGIGKYGSRAYHLCQTTSKAVGTYYSKDIPLKASTKYVISYDYKVEKGAGFRLYAAELGYSNLTPSVYCEPGTLDTAEWQHAEAVFTTADFFDAEAGWALVLTTSSSNNIGDGSVSAYIDNLAIREYVSGAPAEGISIDQQSVTLAPSRTTKLTVTATPDSADLNALEWTSSNENVAYVVAGNVIGVGAGTATITVRTKNGKTATCDVTVNGMASPLTNGSFETEEGWVLSGNAAYSRGNGVLRSTGLKLMPAEGGKANGSISQQITGLQPDSAYQLHFQMRRTSNANSYFCVKLLDQNGKVLSESKGGGKTGNVKYTSAFYKYDVVTPDTIKETDKLTLVLEYAEGVGHFTFDHLILAEATSEVDLIVSDVLWTPDGDQLTPNTNVNFSVAFLNTGAEDYAGGKPVTIDIFVDAQKVKTLTYTGQILRNELLVVACKTEDVWVATKGDHTITAKVNTSMTVLEADDTNNHYSVNLRVTEEENFVTAPDAALAQGFNRLVFSDHFETNTTIDHKASGEPGYKWYITRPWGEANLTADDYRVEDGVLYVTTEDTKWNYSMCTVDAKTPGVGFSFNKGYMEIRVRMKQTAEGGTVTGIRVPAVWSFSDETIWGTRPVGKTSIELDWIEYWGNKYKTVRFDTTLHETRYDAQGNEIGKVSHGEQYTNPIGDYQWHTYGMAWNEGLLKTYFDDQLIGQLTYGANEYPDPLPSGSVNVQAGTADAYEGLWNALDYQNMTIILGGASDFPLEVDWVHVWQADGSVEAIPETEMEADSFVDMHLKNDRGEVINQVTIDNYQDLLACEEAYLALSPEAQALVDAALGTSYLTWVSEIRMAINVAENFMAYYACSEDGVPYTGIDAENCDWVLGAQTEWLSLSEFTRNLIDYTLSLYGLPTFTQLLQQAAAFEFPEDESADAPMEDAPTDEPVEEAPITTQPITETNTVLVIVVVLGGLIVLGGAALLTVVYIKKRKRAVK